MKPNKMYLDQRRINEVIAYCILIDVVLAYILKRFQGPATTVPLAFLYLLNIVVLLAVYRFWKFPVFEWDDAGFIIYGISPFKREAGLWRKVEKAGFKGIEVRKGKLREHLVIFYVTQKGAHRMGLVPMYMVGFRDRLRAEFLSFAGKKRIASL